jgi:hypothetical protein
MYVVELHHCNSEDTCTITVDVILLHTCIFTITVDVILLHVCIFTITVDVILLHTCIFTITVDGIVKIHVCSRITSL